MPWYQGRNIYRSAQLKYLRVISFRISECFTHNLKIIEKYYLSPKLAIFSPFAFFKVFNFQLVKKIIHSSSHTTSVSSVQCSDSAFHTTPGAHYRLNIIIFSFAFCLSLGLSPFLNLFCFFYLDILGQSTNSPKS